MTIEEIEHKIACGELSAAQVFTQMRQFICRSDLELAAPDLYEALEVLLDDIRNKHSLSEAHVVGAGTRRALIIARLALAKARGE